jgi:hypothetical protein
MDANPLLSGRSGGRETCVAKLAARMPRICRAHEVRISLSTRRIAWPVGQEYRAILAGRVIHRRPQMKGWEQ